MGELLSAENQPGFSCLKGYLSAQEAPLESGWAIGANFSNKL